MIWKPHVTVAAVIEQDGRFLLVEEQTDDGILFNQPAGPLDPKRRPIASRPKPCLASISGTTPGVTALTCALPTLAACTATSLSARSTTAFCVQYGKRPRKSAPCKRATAARWYCAAWKII
jgi:hypothetical protein